MIQVQGRFMEEVVLELMISTNDPPKYKVAQSPLSMGREKILRAEGRAFFLGRGSWIYSTTATSDHSLHLRDAGCGTCQPEGCEDHGNLSAMMKITQKGTPFPELLLQ